MEFFKNLFKSPEEAVREWNEVADRQIVRESARAYIQSIPWEVKEDALRRAWREIVLERKP